MNSDTRTDPYWPVNARSMSAGVVGDRFVAPAQFAKLLHPSHTVLVGPRGSGKTTLLKMLTTEALTSPRAPRTHLKTGIEFVGVYVPTDIAWSSQLNALVRAGVPEVVAVSVAQSWFTFSVQTSIVRALSHRITVAGDDAGYLGMEPLDCDSDTEVRLAKSLAHAWELSIPVPSLLGVASALSKRLADFAREVQILAIGADGSNVELPEQIGMGGLSFVPIVSAGLDAISVAVPELQDTRWALLLDELEIAPAAVRNLILAALRSTDERLLFKVALAPYSEDLALFSEAFTASPGNDHEEVSLSYGYKEDGYEFTLHLIETILRIREHPAKDLITVFGESTFPIDTKLAARLGIDGRAESTAKQSRYISKLVQDDRTFRKYVESVAGSTEALLKLRGDARAQKVRKVLPLIIVRAAFRNPDIAKGTGTRRFTTRKNPDIYAGLVSLATMLEGNPRWIIGVVTALLDESPGTSVSAARQASELDRTVSRFRALLSTIPAARPASDKQGLLWFVDTIGKYFRDRIIADDFSADPVGTFTVDSHASDEWVSLVGTALNNGAIVYVPDAGGTATPKSLRGKRFRLAYLLASVYGLPLRLERDVSLDSVFKKRTKTSPSDLEVEPLF